MNNDDIDVVISSFDDEFGLDEIILLSNNGEVRRIILDNDKERESGIYG